MKKILIVLLLVVSCACALASEGGVNISNSYFSFTMPSELSNLYYVDKFDNGIYVIEKVSGRAGIGGLAFGVKIYKSPSEYFDIPNVKKLGELTSKKGTIYDVVFIRPSEIQYGEGEEVKKNYNILYDYGEKIEVKAVNGNKYEKGKGVNGEGLYREVLKKYIKAITENWSADKYEKEGLGYVYPLLAKENENIIDKVGYAFYDLNSDGIEELFIGGVINKKQLIFDVYTMVNRKPTHVVSGGNIDRYYVCSEVYLCSEYLNNKNDLYVYILGSNSSELQNQATFVYDKTKRFPWLVGYGNGALEGYTRSAYKKNAKFFKDYKKFDYTPLSEFK